MPLAQSKARADGVSLSARHVIAATSRPKVPDSPLVLRIAVQTAGRTLIAHRLGFGAITEMSLKGHGGEILYFRAAWEGTNEACDIQIGYCLAGRPAAVLKRAAASELTRRSPIKIWIADQFG